MDSESDTSGATSRDDLLEDHFSSLEDLHAPEIDAAQNQDEGQNSNPLLPDIPQSGDVQKITSNALFESEVSPGQNLINSAKSEASWRATQDVLTQRVQILEARLLEEAARANAAEAAQITAEQSLAAGFNNFNQQINSLLMKEKQFDEKEADFATHLEVQAHTEEALLALEEQLQSAIEENSRLRFELEHDRRESLELRGRVENTAELKHSLKALTRDKLALEAQVGSLQSALNEQREAAGSLAERFAASEAVAAQLEAVIREKDEVLNRAQQAEQEAASLVQQLNSLREEANANENVVRQAAREQVAALQELAQKRGAALRQIIEFLDGSGLSDENSAGAGQQEERSEGMQASRAPIDPEKAVELVFNVCQSIVDAEEEWEKERSELEEALQQAVDGSEDLIRRLRSEEAHSKELEAQYDEVVQALRSVQDLVQSASEMEVRAQSAEAALETCRQELADAAAKAAAAALEASQLKSAAEVAREKEKEAVNAAKRAEEEAAELRNGAEARENRADEMRAAAAAAMDLAGNLQQGIQRACASTATQLHQTAALLSSGEVLSSFRNGRYNPQVESVVDNIHSCIAKLQSIERLANGESSSAGEMGGKVVEAVQGALGEAAAGFARLVPLIEEHRRMHSALSRAVQEGDNSKQKLSKNGGNGDTSRDDAQSPTSQVPETLEELLGQLLDRFAGLIEAVQSEKSAVEAQFNDLQVEFEELSRHAESLESVLRSAVHAGPGSDTAGEALIQLASAKSRVAELEAICAELQESAERAQQEAVEAKASAARDWSGVRADVAQLVQHAERAQIDAESALQQQRAETAKQLSTARAKEHAALAARSKAEAEAAKLREGLVKKSKELDSAASKAAIWEAKAAANEQNLRAAERRLAMLQQELEATQTAAADDGQQDVLRESEFVLRQRVSMLEGLVGELQQHAAVSATQLVEAQSRVEAAEAEAARHIAAAEAASTRAQSLEGKVVALQSQVTALELNLVEQQTNGTGETATANPALMSSSVALIQKQPDQRAIVPYANAEEELRLLLTVPISNDVPALKRRLEAALRQIENLKALNNNLQQQLSVASASLKSKRTSAQASVEPISAGGSVAMAHAMIDALQEQMLSLGLAPLNSQQNKDGSEDEAAPPLQRVIGLWKQACAARDERIEESERRVNAAGRELEAKDAELVATRHAVESLKQAREDAAVAASELEKQLREAEEQRRAAEIQVARLNWAAEERDALNARVKGLEGQCKQLESRAASAEARAVEAEHALAGERAKANQLLERLDNVDQAEIKVQDAEKRAAEAEEALSKHLEGAASQLEGSSLGLQLEKAWETERKLALRIEQLQTEAAEAKSQAETALKDVEMYEKRSIALQEQLDEAIAALAEQGAALEALQDALKEQTMRARR